MKSILSTILLFLNSWIFLAQFGPQQIISDTSPSPSRSIPLDIDNDGFIDILTSSDSKLKWFRNLDGLGNFSDEIVISENIAFYLSIEFVDFDSDGDKDLVYLENNPNKLEWIENLDGQGNFGPVQVILENQPDYIYSFKAIDLDTDNDIDLVIKYQESFEDRIVWYENIDGQGTLSDEIILFEGVGFTNIYPPLFEDIDADGNLDILFSYEISSDPVKIVWFKGTGNATFGSEQLIYQFEFLQSDFTSIYNIQYQDITADGKKDIIITTNHDDLGVFVRWFKNIDEEGNFEPYQQIPNAIGVGFYSFYDFDNDGDNDLLGGTRFGDIFYWLENEDGLGNFSERNIISTEIDFIGDAKAADFDGDGVLDVVSASSGDNKIAWYKNEILGTEDFNKNNLILYPNPTKDIISIISEETISKIEVYSLLGKKIYTLSNTKSINLSNLEIGVYFIYLFNENGNRKVFKVIKE